jgi:putative hydrolase of the HAD superfamily
MEKQFTTILFDFFGTLVVYTPGSYFRNKRKKAFTILTEYGLDATYEEWADTFSSTYKTLVADAKVSQNEFHMRTIFSQSLEKLPSKQISQDKLDEIIIAYVEEWSEDIHELEGIHSLLDYLSQKYTLGIVSNTHYPDLITYNLRKQNIEKYFSHITTSVEHGKRKPHPSLFTSALQSIGSEKDQTVFVGDTYDEDYLGAQAAGMEVYLIDPASKHPTVEGKRIRQLQDLKLML